MWRKTTWGGNSSVVVKVWSGPGTAGKGEGGHLSPLAFVESNIHSPPGSTWVSSCLCLCAVWCRAGRVPEVLPDRVRATHRTKLKWENEAEKQESKNHVRVKREQSCFQGCWCWIWLRVFQSFHGASGEFITGVVPPVTHPFSSSRCWSDHDLQTERAAAAITGCCLGNSAGPEATPGDEDHWGVELQGWLWAPRLLSVYSGPKVKFRAHHDDVKARGERWHCGLAAQRKLVWMPDCFWCKSLRTS